mmetsp:Transcript_39648/g.81161  ORF Transcript_39648/g.81161 Transcript_39648/m.81161 type:complete len:213 (+) Transcript_39648:592-1230(+)
MKAGAPVEPSRRTASRWQRLPGHPGHLLTKEACQHSTTNGQSSSLVLVPVSDQADQTATSYSGAMLWGRAWRTLPQRIGGARFRHPPRSKTSAALPALLLDGSGSVQLRRLCHPYAWLPEPTLRPLVRLVQLASPTRHPCLHATLQGTTQSAGPLATQCTPHRHPLLQAARSKQWILHGRLECCAWQRRSQLAAYLLQQQQTPECLSSCRRH